MREDFDTSSISAIDWAEEFCETIKNMDGIEAIDKVTDPGFMVGWFANYWAAIHDPLCARIEALENALEALVDFKEMKDNYGKPANYEELKTKLWARARNVLPSPTGE